MKLIEDRYDGVTIDNTNLPNTKEKFEEEIIKLLENIKEKKLLWIKLDISNSEYIPILTKLGFEFHHCNEKDLTLVKKLIQNPIIPTAKNHTLGVGAIVRDGDKILVIKDRFQSGYKLPGGHVDPYENITTALKREVLEETGIIVEFESIANIGHFTPSQFGESNLYIVCTAKAISKEINIQDSSEIEEARWLEIDEFLNKEDTNNYNKKIIETFLANKELKLTHHLLTLSIKSDYELFF